MSSQWSFSAFGLDSLTLSPSTPRDPGPGEVLLRLRAASLNYRDLLMIRGHYDPRVPRPLVPCSDAVGVIQAVGPGVNASIGERRIPIFAQGWISGPPKAEHLRTTLGGPLPGTLQTHLTVPIEATVPAPDGLSDIEAATLPCAGVTALHALHAAGVGPGSRVLTLGTGGVSTFALQLAHSMGAEVAVTSSCPVKLDRARDLGAAFTLNYLENPRWGKAVAGWSGGGVDAVIEVGGVGTLAQSLKAVRVGGRISLIGVLGGGSGEVPLVRALMKSVQIQGIMVGSREHLVDLLGRIHSGGIRPVVDRVFPYRQAPAALHHLESGAHHGKVTVDLTDEGGADIG